LQINKGESEQISFIETGEEIGDCLLSQKDLIGEEDLMNDAYSGDD